MGFESNAVANNEMKRTKKKQEKETMSTIRGQDEEQMKRVDNCLYLKPISRDFARHEPALHSQADSQHELYLATLL